MFKLDNNLLIELGLGGLSPQDKNRMLAHIYETLEMRVGMRLAEGMSESQLDEFEALMPLPEDTQEVRAQKEQDALKWLESNFPNYKQVVAEELEKLKTEVKAAAPQIIASTQQAPQPGMQPGQPQPQQFADPAQAAAPQMPPVNDPNIAPAQDQNPPQAA